MRYVGASERASCRAAHPDLEGDEPLAQRGRVSMASVVVGQMLRAGRPCLRLLAADHQIGLAPQAQPCECVQRRHTEGDSGEGVASDITVS